MLASGRGPAAISVTAANSAFNLLIYPQRPSGGITTCFGEDVTEDQAILDPICMLTASWSTISARAQTHKGQLPQNQISRRDLLQDLKKKACFQVYRLVWGTFRRTSLQWSFDLNKRPQQRADGLKNRTCRGFSPTGSFRCARVSSVTWRTPGRQSAASRGTLHLFLPSPWRVYSRNGSSAADLTEARRSPSRTKEPTVDTKTTGRPMQTVEHYASLKAIRRKHWVKQRFRLCWRWTAAPCRWITKTHSAGYGRLKGALLAVVSLEKHYR